jgi:hypothetical protein
MRIEQDDQAKKNKPKIKKPDLSENSKERKDP